MMAVPSTPSSPASGRYPQVAMVGGGQLARMTHQAAIALGQSLRVLAADAADPAAQVSPDVVIGSHTDLDALRRVAVGAHALTFDHEHVPTELLEKLVAEGVNVAPPPEALVYAQDKLVMRRRLEALGAAVPRYAAVEYPDDLDSIAEFAR
ncbi:MAG: 5-(carboxyamino)imidazole ribonucleotide synthase, partial [Mycobacterium sp.]